MYAEDPIAEGLSTERVFVVDKVPDRLRLASHTGAEPTDDATGAPAQQIADELRTAGTDRGIDAVGYQATAAEGELLFKVGRYFEKGQTMGTGQADAKQYAHRLRDVIIAGRATPSFVVSQQLPLFSAPDAYSRFDKREEGYTKMLLQPGKGAGRFRAAAKTDMSAG